MPNTPVNLPWGTYILVVYDCNGAVVDRETYTGQSGTSMMDVSSGARRDWDRVNPAGAPHKTDW
jgi:hypothetical protein